MSVMLRLRYLGLQAQLGPPCCRGRAWHIASHHLFSAFQGTEGCSFPRVCLKNRQDGEQVSVSLGHPFLAFGFSYGQCVCAAGGVGGGGCRGWEGGVCWHFQVEDFYNSKLDPWGEETPQELPAGIFFWSRGPQLVYLLLFTFQNLSVGDL